MDRRSIKCVEFEYTYILITDSPEETIEEYMELEETGKSYEYDIKEDTDCTLVSARITKGL